MATYNQVLTLNGSQQTLYAIDVANGLLPVIGVAVTNNSTTASLKVYVDGVHKVANSGDTATANGATIPVGATRQFWASGGGSKPGSGLITNVTVIGTNAETVTFAVLCR